jgi:hypothetical protein
MVQKCIAVFLVLMLSGLAAPAFAADYTNTKLIPNTFPMALASSSAFALPQSSQPQAQPTSQPQAQPQPPKPNSGASETNAGMKWGGIVLMIGGAGLVARGASITDPCSAYSGPGVLCTSNYQTVRAASLALGGVALVTGAVLFMRRHH